MKKLGFILIALSFALSANATTWSDMFSTMNQQIDNNSSTYQAQPYYPSQNANQNYYQVQSPTQDYTYNRGIPIYQQQSYYSPYGTTYGAYNQTGTNLYNSPARYYGRGLLYSLLNR